GAAELVIAFAEGKLTARAGMAPATKLTAINKLSFKSDDGAITITFRREGDKVAGLTLKRDKKETAFRRVEAAGQTEPKTVGIEDRGGVVKAPLNWTSFRGPGASGVADGQFPPLSWDVEKGRNVLWKTPIPGLGHS